MRRRLGERDEHVPLGGRPDRNVEQEHRQTGEDAGRARTQQPCGLVQQLGAIGHARGAELTRMLGEQPGEVGPGRRQRRHGRGVHPGFAQFPQGRRERPRKARALGDRFEIGQRRDATHVEGRARGQRIGAERRRRREAAGRERRARRPRRELSRREAMQAEGPAALDRQRPAEIVGGLAGRTDDHDFRRRTGLSDELARRRETRARRRGDDCLQHVLCLPCPAPRGGTSPRAGAIGSRMTMPALGDVWFR